MINSTSMPKSLDKIILPRIDRLSKLSQNREPQFSNLHPRNDNYYPIIIGSSLPTRARVLALGGPYEQAISYRREHAGNLQSGYRCYLCLEIFTTERDNILGGFREEAYVWGMRWCGNCLQKWTVDPQMILDGLHAVLKKYEKDLEIKSVWPTRFRGPYMEHPIWKPFVDAVLRKHVGLDYDTAVAKTEYSYQLASALTAVKHPVTALRRALRQDIVKIAQKMSTSSSYTGTATRFAKSTFATPTELPRFLFPARDLHEEEMFEPYDPDEEWIPDPTMSLKTSKGVHRKLESALWKRAQAQTMLNALFNPRDFGGGVTTFLRAADSWHVRRISKDLSADLVIDLFNTKFPRPPSPFYMMPAWKGMFGNRIDGHLDILLSKLFIYRNEFPFLPQLSPYELEIAKEVYFKKLALGTCVTCPVSGLLYGNRGVESFVQHLRRNHPGQYWDAHKWIVIG